MTTEQWLKLQARNRDWSFRDRTSGEKITLIYPSRERADICFDNYARWWQAAEQYSDDLFKIVVSVDADDPQLPKYIDYFRSETLLISDSHSSVEAINRAARIVNGDILMVISDDMYPCQGWYKKIIEETRGKKDWILKTQDGIQNWICTLPIMDRAYYNRFGYIYYPGYQHLFCDTELTCVADILGRKITSNLLFHHNHYSIGKATLDSVYSKNDRTNEQGEKLFLERYARNFDLPPGNKIQDRGMIDWLKKRHVA